MAYVSVSAASSSSMPNSSTSTDSDAASPVTGTHIVGTTTISPETNLDTAKRGRPRVGPEICNPSLITSRSRGEDSQNPKRQRAIPQVPCAARPAPSLTHRVGVKRLPPPTWIGAPRVSWWCSASGLVVSGPFPSSLCLGASVRRYRALHRLGLSWWRRGQGSGRRSWGWARRDRLSCRDWVRAGAVR